ncbi:MAG TPA: hypothetical protein VF555_16490 [Variovorax sp.]
MSAAHFINACPVCGAEESLDALLMRMVEDTEARGLIADVILQSLPLSKDVLRYLRLHKPAKQRLRMATARKVLAELVPDLRRVTIERKGRIWAVSGDTWKAAFQAVFDLAERGSLTLPLEGNGYLYGVITRMVDREEAAAEEDREQGRRHRAHGAPATVAPAPTTPAPQAEDVPDPEAAAKAEAIRKQLRDQLAAKKARQGAEDAA